MISPWDLGLNSIYLSNSMTAMASRLHDFGQLTIRNKIKQYVKTIKRMMHLVQKE